jgi:hypothetical protein
MGYVRFVIKRTWPDIKVKILRVVCKAIKFKANIGKRPTEIRAPGLQNQKH